MRKIIPRLKQPRNLVAGLLVAIAISTGIALSQISKAPTIRSGIEWLEQPRVLADFRLNSQGQVFNNESLLDRWHFIVFGYTQCPDICPTLLAELAPLVKQLDGFNIQLVFVSVDPGRDTVDHIAAYVSYFHAGFLGVTGAHEQLQSLAESLGLRFRLTGAGENYQVSHSITISLIDTQGLLQGRMRSGFDLHATARDIANHLQSPG